MSVIGEPGPIRAVLFDLHSTLVDQGDPYEWLELAWRHAGRPGSPAELLGDVARDELADWVNRIWEHARRIDPDNERDLSPRRHRAVYDELVRDLPAVDDDLAHSLYATLLDTWFAYDDAVPVLVELRRRGVKTVLVSNVGIDVRPVLDRAGLSGLLDAVVLSYEIGAVKPNPEVFQQALDAVGVAAENALMVGDSPVDDAGAARLGVRTLLLPRTSGPRHGLDAVLRLVSDSSAGSASDRGRPGRS